MVHIIDNLYVDADKYGYAIKKDTGRNDKDGNRVYDPLAYPSTLEGVFQYVLRYRQRAIVENNDVELKELFRLFKEEYQKIQNILEEVKRLEKI